MSPQEAAALRTRIAELERVVQALRTRLELLERQLAPRSENPADRSTVQQKVVYDWQA